MALLGIKRALWECHLWAVCRGCGWIVGASGTGSRSMGKRQAKEGLEAEAYWRSWLAAAEK